MNKPNITIDNAATKPARVARNPPELEAEIMAAAFADPDAQPLTQAQIDGWRPPTLSKVVRNKLRMTRAAFADAYGIPEATQEAWERHKAEPTAVEIVYLKLIERKPEVAKLRVDCGLSRRDYDALLARAGDEDAEDRMTLLIAAEARSEQPLPEPVSAAILRGESMLTAVRRWRNVSQAELSQASGLALVDLDDIEQRRAAGSPETLQNLAKQLNVPIGWLG